MSTNQTVQNGAEPNPTQLTTLWDMKACALFLKKSPRWLWAQLQKSPSLPGSIPHVRIGRTPRFFPEDIAWWVKAGCPPAEKVDLYQVSREKLKYRRRTP